MFGLLRRIFQTPPEAWSALTWDGGMVHRMSGCGHPRKFWQREKIEKFGVTIFYRYFTTMAYTFCSNAISVTDSPLYFKRERQPV